MSAACIELQDERGVDVCLLFAALWLADLGQIVDNDAVARMDAHCEHWRRDVIQPLRQRRRVWREDPGREADYVAIKALELRAEREQLARLEALQFTSAPTAASLTESNIAAVLAHFGVDEAQRQRWVQRLCAIIAG